MLDKIYHAVISIHALREEGDAFANDIEMEQIHFYPRPPRGGRHTCVMGYITIFTISIHALREEGDSFNEIHKTKMTYISIHALREEGDPDVGKGIQDYTISIHALREEGDSKNRDKISIFKQIIQHSARI